MNGAQIEFIILMMTKAYLAKGHWVHKSADGTVEHGPHTMSPGQ